MWYDGGDDWVGNPYPPGITGRAIRVVINSDDAAEVSLAFGDIDSIVDEVLDMMINSVRKRSSNLRQILSDTNYYTTYTDISSSRPAKDPLVYLILY